HREPARQHTRCLGGRDSRGSQVSGSVDALSVQRCWRAAARHDTTILPYLSPVVSGAPGLFQPPITQRDIKAEVANFVGGVIEPPCGVPVAGRRTCPSSITPARSIARSSLRT